VLSKSVDERLSYPRAAIAFLLPLAVSVFRMSVPASQVVVTLFVARATGTELHAVQLATLVVMAALLSFTVPGVPNAMFIATLPIFETLGLPAGPIGMLLAVDIIPGAFKTMLNVTGHFTAGALAVRPSGPYKKPASIAAVGAS
jgi:proton glutamate symport protein